MAEPAIVVSTMSDILSACLRGTKEQEGQNQSRDYSPGYMSHCCILRQHGVRQPGKSEVGLPEYNAFLRLRVFHKALTAGGLELIG